MSHKALAVILTVSMVMSQTPSGYAYAASKPATSTTTQSAATTTSTTTQSTTTQSTSSSKSQSTSSSAAATSSAATTSQATTVDVALDLQNAYISVSGQTVAAPTTKVTVPAGKKLTFSAAADSGYEVSSVSMTADGETTKLSANADGTYSIPAASVAAGVGIKVASTQTSKVAASAATPIASSTASATKTTYTYQDDNVTVTATLSDPTAVPDNAQFVVTPVTKDSTSYNYNAYLDALNGGTTTASSAHTAENTLLYDVAFMVPKTDASGNAVAGETVEYEPTAGTVKIDMQFKKDQLSSELGVTSDTASNVEVTHLPLTDSVKSSTDSTAKATNITKDDVKVDTLTSDKESVSVGDTQSASFTTDSLCVFSFSKNGGQQVAGTYWEGSTTDYQVSSLSDALGIANDVAIYANTLDNQAGHIEGSIAVNTYKANSDGNLDEAQRLMTQNEVKSITINKTVDATSASDRIFQFGIYSDGESSLLVQRQNTR
jgi:hypothetical protein